MLRHIQAISYVTPLREGGSLPALVEADDDGTYVLKFRGAGQGALALVAEVIVGELARRLGFWVPELVRIELAATMAPGEPDQEIQDLLRASSGTNLGMDFLPGAIGFDPAVHDVDAEWAARLLWLDAFVENVDRTWRNPNLLLWHQQQRLIDHGASLYFHHNWRTSTHAINRPFDASDHLMRPYVTSLERSHEQLAPQITADLIDEVLGLVPAQWFNLTVEEAHAAYRNQLLNRAASRLWLPQIGPS